MVKSGEFELAREINVAQQMEKFIHAGRQTDMTMGQRLVLKKQSQLKADPSFTKIRVAMVGSGEVVGLDECLGGEPQRRRNTVVCNQAGSEICFIPF